MDPAGNIVTLEEDTESDLLVLKDTRMARPRFRHFYGAAWDNFVQKYRQAHKASATYNTTTFILCKTILKWQ